MDSFKEAIGAAVSLESVLCTEQLEQRPSRPPDYQAENQALLALVQELKHTPRNVLQRLVDIALELCRAHSSGISLLEKGPPGQLSPMGDHFRWHAVAGQWAPLIWDTTTRRDYGPCGTVLDRNCTLLFANAHRYYRQFAGVQPLLVEGLLVPLERSRDGLGIGLMLVKNLVQMHGGTVEARSTGLGQGSEFVVSLPVVSEPPKTQAEEPLDAKQAAETSQPSQRRILVVDDNRDSADSLVMLCELDGHQVHTAYDGLEAVEAATSLQPDLVLLDIGLPGLNGYEAARQIRSQPRNQDLMLVALTGWGQKEDRERSEEAGFDAHLVKPVDFNALRKLLAKSGAR